MIVGVLVFSEIVILYFWKFREYGWGGSSNDVKGRKIVKVMFY